MLDRLRTHLAMLRRHGLITEWFDRDIDAGAEWRAEITRQLEAADVILLLVSADFLASDFAYEEEMLRAIERAHHGEATVIGVMLRPVDGWESSPLGKFQVLPQNGRPITRWSNGDEAFRDVAVGIRRLLEDRVRSDSVEEGPHVNETPRVADLATDAASAARGKEMSSRFLNYCCARTRTTSSSWSGIRKPTTTRSALQRRVPSGARPYPTSFSTQVTRSMPIRQRFSRRSDGIRRERTARIGGAFERVSKTSRHSWYEP
jgi:TIR domain